MKLYEDYFTGMQYFKDDPECLQAHISERNKAKAARDAWPYLIIGYQHREQVKQSFLGDGLTPIQQFYRLLSHWSRSVASNDYRLDHPDLHEYAAAYFYNWIIEDPRCETWSGSWVQVAAFMEVTPKQSPFLPIGLTNWELDKQHPIAASS